jgi:hypothetical protein
VTVAATRTAIVELGTWLDMVGVEGLMTPEVGSPAAAEVERSPAR